MSFLNVLQTNTEDVDPSDAGVNMEEGSENRSSDLTLEMITSLELEFIEDYYPQNTLCDSNVNDKIHCSNAFFSPEAFQYSPHLPPKHTSTSFKPSPIPKVPSL